jgi:hypothetical protein
MGVGDDGRIVEVMSVTDPERTAAAAAGGRAGKTALKRSTSKAGFQLDKFYNHLFIKGFHSPLSIGNPGTTPDV